MNRVSERSIMIKRLLACLAGSLVLAMMIGSQEGTQEDYAFAFRQSVLAPRVLIFLGLGVLIFLAMTYRPRVVPYLTRPGVWPFFSGFLAVVAAQFLMHWYDQAGDAKFGTVATAVADTSGISAVTKAFFGWLAWAQLAVVFVAAAVALARRIRPLAFATAALAVVAGAICFLAHRGLVSYGQGLRTPLGPDHSLGYGVAMVGYLVIAVALLAAAMTESEVSRTREVVNAALAFRPGLPLAALGVVIGLIAFLGAGWFSPKKLNVTLSGTNDLFKGQGLPAIASQFLGWLGWVLLAACVVLAGAAVWLRQRMLGWVVAGLGLLAVLLTLITLYDISKIGGEQGFNGATGPWQNLGTGGWMACGAFFCLAGAGFVVATTAPTRDGERAVSSDQIGGSGERSAAANFLSAPGAARTGIMIALAAALFYPPTATSFWQQVLVSEIGIYVLLAVGLNVVVGWAGLLDLGFIAFYAIGSYTTAYLVGSLPITPPSWLHMSPLLAIPFAIVICLLAGLALGAPTLRLRGDYLAIVTLGFGEIIRIIAVNADGVTNGSRGPAIQVPHPVIHLGPIDFTWGLAQLQYWYLLLILIVLVVLAFRRLEASRLGRAWAAVREDEIAAQATGINTVRVTLLAFAIGASTSGLAGVFFASQVGFFNPDNFVLNNSILVVAYVVFGGMGSLPGAMAGAAMLTWLPEFLKDQVPAADRTMWIGAVLLVMMIFRPAGLIPARRRRAELSGLDRPASAESNAVPAGGAMGGH